RSTGRRVNEFFSGVLARIEPALDSLRRTTWTLFKSDQSRVCRVHSVVGNRQPRGVDLRLIRVAYLDPVWIDIADPAEHVRSDRQYHTGYFNWLAECDDCLFIRFIGFRVCR